MAIQMSLNQEDWGPSSMIASLIGCGFVTGSVDYLGTWIRWMLLAITEVTTWTADVRRFKPQAIVLEMGWWDSLRHLINGKVESSRNPDATPWSSSESWT